jgi:membrane protein DedA with SNARE-associated domain
MRCYGSLPSPRRKASRVIAALTNTITDVLTNYGYVAIFVLMVLESACIPIPSEVTMVFGGALTTAAVVGAGNELSLFWVGLLGALGNLVGSWLAYWVGATGGRPAIDRYGRYLLIRPHEIDRAHGWFERRGERAVFIARLLPVIRTFISLPAGVAKMPLGTFSIYTLLGCLPFTYALAFAGHAAGARWEDVIRRLAPLTWGILLICAIAIAIYVARRWRSVRAEYAALDAAQNEHLGDVDDT